MDKYQKNKYLIFWQIKEDSPELLDNQTPIFATLLKMATEDECIENWGRCEGIEKNGKLIYNGFVLARLDNVKIFENKWSKFLDITGAHRYTDIYETRNVLKKWKNRQ